MPRPRVQTAREHIYSLLTPDAAAEVSATRFVSLALGALILANALAVTLETVQEFGVYRPVFWTFEAVSVAIFTVEYLLRLWTCTVEPRYRRPILGRLRYMVSPLALVDAVAILPSLIPGGGLDLRFARMVRLLRLLRALKIARYSRSVQLLARVVRSKQGELSVALLTAAIALVCASGALFVVEHEAQPKAFSSIPAAMWWAVMTLTTVGYGDVYPVTPVGKLVASVIAMCGIALFALPTGILAAGLAEQSRREEEARPRTCPHCGRDINASPEQSLSAGSRRREGARGRVVGDRG